VHFVKIGPLNSDSLDLLAPFENLTALIGVIGLGYVGIPLAMAAVESGFRVVGFDIDAARVAQINRGESFIKHLSSAKLSAAVNGGRLEVTTDFDRLSRGSSRTSAIGARMDASAHKNKSNLSKRILEVESNGSRSSDLGALSPTQTAGSP
jgi:UDP-N-acetyl-D-mannosaminuronate dehydrogenase